MDGYKARIGKEAEIKLESIVRTRKEKEINQVIHSILEDIIIKEESAQKLYMAVVEILKILGNYYAELYQDEDIEELKDFKILYVSQGHEDLVSIKGKEVPRKVRYIQVFKR